MKDPIAGNDDSPDRFDRIEAILTCYPDVTESETALLKLWFDKEASAFDVASLASKEACQVGYGLFRAEHLDRFTIRDWIALAAAIAVLLGGILACGLLAA